MCFIEKNWNSLIRRADLKLRIGLDLDGMMNSDGKKLLEFNVDQL